MADQKWNASPEVCDCEPPASGGGPGGLRWYTSCGAPVCGATPDPFDDPNTPNCVAGQRAGEACQNEGERCDGVASCGASLVCVASDPLQGPGGCPRSRAAYKQDIEYLGQNQLRAYHDQLMSIPLASYEYRHAPSAGRQLGFIIDDIEPSVAAAGDRVNLYGYLSMAVAAIQVQDKQIGTLQQQVADLRARLEDSANDPGQCAFDATTGRCQYGARPTNRGWPAASAPPHVAITLRNSR